MMAKDRIIYLDYAKVICAFLVVFGHLYSSGNTIRNFIYSFHMPFFFLVSGILDTQTGGKTLIYKYMKTIVVPACYYILIFVLLSFSLYACQSWNPQLDIRGDFFSDGLFDTFCQMILSVPKGLVLGHHNSLCNYVVWFLFALFICKCLMLLTRKLPLKVLIPIYLILLPCVLILDIRSFFLGTSLISFPFYFIGSRYRDAIQDLVAYHSRWYVPVVLLLFTYICHKLNGQVSTVGMNVGQQPIALSILLFYVTAISGSFMIITFCRLIEHPSGFILKLSTSLLSILGYQAIFTRAYRNMVGFDQSFIISILIAISIMLLCYFLHLITLRYFPFVLGKSNPNGN